MRYFIAILLLVLFLLLFVVGCKCLPAPTTDTSPPTAGLIIEWTDVQGQLQSQTITSLDTDLTITADSDREISVMYMGSDNQGMRSIHLDYDMSLSTGTGSSTPTLTAIEFVSNCPRGTLSDAEVFGPTGNEHWKYNFATISKNWVGLSNISAKVTVLTE